MNNWCLSLRSLNKKNEIVFRAGSSRVGRTCQPRDRSEGPRGEAEKEREAMHVAVPATAPGKVLHPIQVLSRGRATIVAGSPSAAVAPSVVFLEELPDIWLQTVLPR